LKNRAIGRKILENRRTHHNPTTANSLQQQQQRHKWLRQLFSFFKELKTREKPKTRHAHTRERARRRRRRRETGKYNIGVRGEDRQQRRDS